MNHTAIFWNRQNRYRENHFDEERNQESTCKEGHRRRKKSYEEKVSSFGEANRNKKGPGNGAFAIDGARVETPQASFADCSMPLSVFVSRFIADRISAGLIVRSFLFPFSAPPSGYSK